MSYTQLRVSLNLQLYCMMGLEKYHDGAHQLICFGFIQIYNDYFKYVAGKRY